MPITLLSRREALAAASLSAFCATLVMLGLLAGFETLGGTRWQAGDPVLAREMARCAELPHTVQRERCARQAAEHASLPRVAQAR